MQNFVTAQDTTIWQKSKSPRCSGGERLLLQSQSPPPPHSPSSSGGNRARYCPAWSCGIVHLQPNLHLRTHWPSTPRPTATIGQDAGAVSTLGREKVGGGARWLSGRPANHVRRQRLQSGFAQPCSKVSAVSDSLFHTYTHNNNNNNAPYIVRSSLLVDSSSLARTAPSTHDGDVRADSAGVLPGAHHHQRRPQRKQTEWNARERVE